jgi:hypothetical protein
MKKVLSAVLLGLLISAAAPRPALAAACLNDDGYGEVFIGGAAAELEATGPHVIWTRMQSADTNNNSYLLEVNELTCFKVGDSQSMKPNEWVWVSYQDGNLDKKITYDFLSKTGNALKLIGSEANVKIDRLMILPSSSGCVPAGLGDNCGRPITAITSSAPVGGSPSASFGPRNVGTVNGTVRLSEADQSGVASVTYFAGGRKLVSYDAPAPFDTTLLSNGTYSMDVKTLYVSGGVANESFLITIENPSNTFGPVTRWLRLNSASIRLACAVLAAVAVVSAMFVMLRRLLLNHKLKKYHGF